MLQDIYYKRCYERYIRQLEIAFWQLTLIVRLEKAVQKRPRVYRNTRDKIWLDGSFVYYNAIIERSQKILCHYDTSAREKPSTFLSHDELTSASHMSRSCLYFIVGIRHTESSRDRAWERSFCLMLYNIIYIPCCITIYIIRTLRVFIMH